MILAFNIITKSLDAIVEMLEAGDKNASYFLAICGVGAFLIQRVHTHHSAV